MLRARADGREWEQANKGMVESRRILSVSYGAFSCRLEGYDDAAGTLQDVAMLLSEISTRNPAFGHPDHAPTTSPDTGPAPAGPSPIPGAGMSPPKSGGAIRRAAAMKLALLRASMLKPGLERAVLAAGPSARRAARLNRQAQRDVSNADNAAGTDTASEHADFAQAGPGGAKARPRSDEAKDQPAPERPMPEPPISGPPGEDIPVSRLMDVADSKLSGADLRRRRDAIAHVKAAVAATRAAGRSTEENAPPTST